MKITIPVIFYILLTAVGIAIWLGWGIVKGVWLDIGLYSISIIFILAGITGFFLYRAKAQEEDE